MKCGIPENVLMMMLMVLVEDCDRVGRVKVLFEKVCWSEERDQREQFPHENKGKCLRKLPVIVMMSENSM
jgi:hypothetical protein